MGYTTDFDGYFELNKPLKPEHAAYLHKFSDTRRMKRSEKITAGRPDPIREAVGLPVGKDGGYFVGAGGMCGQEGGFGGGHDDDRNKLGILEYNSAPSDQPGLWCKWEPTEDNQGIQWSGAEKFYEYIPWLEYLITHFLAPWGYVLNGTVKWSGEDSEDHGKIVVTKNKVKTLVGKIVYGDEEADEERAS